MAVVNMNDAGSLEISSKAFKDIAVISASMIEGVSPAKNDYVDCKFKDGDLIVKLSVKINVGLDIVKTCGKVQKSIHETFLQMTGVEAKEINIDITGFNY